MLDLSLLHANVATPLAADASFALTVRFDPVAGKLCARVWNRKT
jgi:hypothetical protein